MRELAGSAKPKQSYRVYFVGGGTAVLEGWRDHRSMPICMPNRTHLPRRSGHQSHG
jgi:hypothetical protein